MIDTSRLKFDELLVDQRHGAERLPRGCGVCRLAHMVLAAAVVTQSSRLEHAGQADLRDRGLEIGERVDRRERRRRNLQLPEQRLLVQPVLRGAERRDRRQERFRCGDLRDRRDRHVLDVEGDRRRLRAPAPRACADRRTRR